MSRNYMLLSCMALLAVLTGCSSVKTFDYCGTTAELPAAGAIMPGTATKTIAVMPFLEMRGVRDPRLDSDPALADRADDFPEEDGYSYALGLVPLLHGGFVDRRAPELNDDFISIGRFHFDPVNDLANAAAISLKASGMFKKVSRANTLQQADADYIWRGTIVNSAYTGTVFTYCITYLGSWVLWTLGAPYGKSVNCLWVKFELIDRKTGMPLWSRDYLERDYLLQWLYARLGQDVSMYPELMKRAMNKAIVDLSAQANTMFK